MFGYAGSLMDIVVFPFMSVAAREPSKDSRQSSSHQESVRWESKEKRYRVIRP